MFYRVVNLCVMCYVLMRYVLMCHVLCIMCLCAVCYVLVLLLACFLFCSETCWGGAGFLRSVCPIGLYHVSALLVCMHFYDIFIAEYSRLLLNILCSVLPIYLMYVERGFVGRGCCWSSPVDSSRPIRIVIGCLAAWV